MMTQFAFLIFKLSKGNWRLSVEILMPAKFIQVSDVDISNDNQSNLKFLPV